MDTPKKTTVKGTEEMFSLCIPEIDVQNLTSLAVALKDTKKTPPLPAAIVNSELPP